MRGNELILRPPPCEDAWLELCYEGGYPLNEDDCFVGLTPELADLALLKAQALAYRNPRLLLDLAGYTRNNNSNSGSTNTSTDEVTTVVKEKSCNRETTTTTKHGATTGATANSGSGASPTGSALASLSTINWTALATQAENAYQAALQQRTASTSLPLRRNGYRSRIH